MNIEIISKSDENFKIDVTKFGGQYLATDGERLCIDISPLDATKCVETLQQGMNPADPNSAPLENSRDGHPFDPFSGTSWAGKPQGFN